jgi:hypothetical protein
MPASRVSLVLLTAAVAASAGCRNVAERVGKSPLKPPQMSPDSVAIEVFFVRFPFNDPDANGRLWEEVDEMHLPGEVRQRLARNGFRVGLAGGQVPATLARLMELKDKPDANPPGLETRVTDLEHKPPTVRRRMELRPGVRSEIVAGDVQDELSVLYCSQSGLEGDTFHLAQPVMDIRAYPERDGRVRIRMVPEIHHGESRLRHVITPGMVRLESGKNKRAFDEMAIEAVLAPGHMLILSTLPDRSGSLGYRFFTLNPGGQLEQKLMIVRLAQTQHDALFDSLPVVDLDFTAHESGPPRRVGAGPPD